MSLSEKPQLAYLILSICNRFNTPLLLFLTTLTLALPAFLLTLSSETFLMLGCMRWSCSRGTKISGDTTEKSWSRSSNLEVTCLCTPQWSFRFKMEIWASLLRSKSETYRHSINATTSCLEQFVCKRPQSSRTFPACSASVPEIVLLVYPLRCWHVSRQQNKNKKICGIKMMKCRVFGECPFSFMRIVSCPSAKVDRGSWHILYIYIYTQFL